MADTRTVTSSMDDRFVPVSLSDWFGINSLKIHIVRNLFIHSVLFIFIHYILANIHSLRDTSLQKPNVIWFRWIIENGIKRERTYWWMTKTECILSADRYRNTTVLLDNRPFRNHCTWNQYKPLKNKFDVRHVVLEFRVQLFWLPFIDNVSSGIHRVFVSRAMSRRLLNLTSSLRQVPGRLS